MALNDNSVDTLQINNSHVCFHGILPRLHLCAPLDNNRFFFLRHKIKMRVYITVQTHKLEE